MIKNLVLVLDNRYMPVLLIPEHNALVNLFTNRFKLILDDFSILEFKNWINNNFSTKSINLDISRYILTPSKRLLVPNTIKTDKVINLENFSTKCYKSIIYLRDKYTCQYCGKRLKHSELTIDHVIPKSKGGNNTFENLVTCCKSCNSIKNNKLLEECNLTLLNNPKKISRYTILKRKCKFFKDRWNIKWKHFFN